MTLLAAFQVLLHRYSGQDDVVVGIADRQPQPREIEGLIGFFVNTLVLRDRPGGRPGLPRAAGAGARAALGAFAHQDLPFEKLVEELQPERDLSRTPLFQVMFAAPERARAGAGAAGPRAAAAATSRAGTAKFDLTLR